MHEAYIFTYLHASVYRWVRLSEEDDEWASQLAHRRPTDEDGGSVRLEAWLLIDGAEVGFGMLLARVPL